MILFFSISKYAQVLLMAVHSRPYDAGVEPEHPRYKTCTKPIKLFLLLTFYSMLAWNISTIFFYQQ